MIVKTSFGEYHINGIYQHFKGNYYMIDCVSKLHDSENVFLINYHECTPEGLYTTIRKTKPNGEDDIIHQPFATHETRWNDEVIGTDGLKRPRFRFFKSNQLTDQ